MKTGYDQHFKKLSEASKSDAQRLRENVGRRMRTKKTARKMPIKLVMISLAGVLCTGVGLYYAEYLEKFFQNIEVTAFGTAIAAEPEKPGGKAEAAAPADKKDLAPMAVKTDFSEEEISHLSKLNERKKELDAREEELNRVEAELAVQKQNLDSKLVDLEKARKNISSVLEERVVADDKRVETLVQMYSSMKPQQAAKVIESIDEDLAVEILGRMKKKVAAEVMNLMKSEKAQVLSEKYAGYRARAPASTDVINDATKETTP
jgi:flagellar motility protein MotE (MotC chaperone)